MATKLNKAITRETDIPGIGPALVTLEVDGISIRPKGLRRKVHMTWDEVIHNSVLPDMAPAKASASPEAKKAWLGNRKDS